jgi:hypothetical protein
LIALPIQMIRPANPYDSDFGGDTPPQVSPLSGRLLLIQSSACIIVQEVVYLLGGVNRFSDHQIPLKKLFGFWIRQIFYTDLRLLLIQWIVDLSNTLARIVDFACNLVRILECDFIVEL